LGMIHKTGILHNDTYKRNLLVVRNEPKGIWTDFSCSQMGAEGDFGEELESAQGIILEMLYERGRRIGAREITTAIAANTPMIRRVLGFIFSFVITLEGLGAILLYAIQLPVNVEHSPFWAYWAIRHGALNMFAAALLAMISSTIHLRTPLFNIALIVKFLYLLFSMSSSCVVLITPTSSGLQRVWAAVRITSALLLLGNDIGELIGLSQHSLEDVPGWQDNESSGSEASSAISEYSSHESERSR